MGDSLEARLLHRDLVVSGLKIDHSVTPGFVRAYSSRCRRTQILRRYRATGNHSSRWIFHSPDELTKSRLGQPTDGEKFEERREHGQPVYLDQQAARLVGNGFRKH